MLKYCFFRCLVAFTFLASFAAPVTSAMAQDVDATSVEDAIVVWGTAVRSNIVGVDEEDITLKQPDHLADILDIVPGVQIAGAHSTVSRINVRGLDDRDLLIYQDGALQANYMWTHVGSILVTPESLQSVEVDLGTNGVAYGGLGGVVRFETKSAKDLLAAGAENMTGRISASANTNDALAFSLIGAIQAAPRVDILGFVRLVERDDYETGAGLIREGTAGTTWAGLIKAGVDIRDNQRLEIAFDGYRDEGDAPFFPDLSPITSQILVDGTLIPSTYTRDLATLNYQASLYQTDLQATLSYNVSELTRDERPAAGLFGRGTLARGRIEATSLNVRADTVLLIGDFEPSLRYGVEWLDQKTAFKADLTTNRPAADQALDTLALFAQLDAPLSRSLSVRGGVRQTWHDLTFGETGDNPRFNDLTYTIGASLFVTPELTLNVDSTTLFKGPELNRPFSGGGLTKLDNPELVPETGRNTQIGLAYETDVGPVDLDFGVVAFHTNIDNFILEARAPGATDGSVQDINVGTLTITGGEANLRATFNRGWISASYSKADYDADNLDFGPFVLTTADAVYAWREVGDTIGLDMHYAFEDIGLELSWNSQFVRRKVTFNDEVKPAYDIHNLYARWSEPFNVSGLALTFGVDNLLNETYAPHASRTGTRTIDAGVLVFDDVAPGRNIKFTIEAVF